MEAPAIGKERLAAFSDGVIAIIITIMVLELKVPTSGSFSALRPLLPAFPISVLSFVCVGIYRNNHRCRLLWLSLLPLPTGFSRRRS